MSASREKRSRKEVSASPAAAQQTSQKKKTRNKNILIGIAITLVVVLIIGSIVLFKGPYFRTHSTAVTIGEHELSPVMVRYYYADQFSQLSQQYGQLMSYMFSDLIDIQDEIYDKETGETWGDYLMDAALAQIAKDYTVYDEAMANGYELSEDAQAAIDQSASYIDLYSQISGVSADAYVRNVYGAGADVASYQEYQRVKITAYYYCQSVRESFSYTDEQLRAADAEDPTAYSSYTYHSFLVSGYSDSEDQAEKDAAMEDARVRAEAMAEASDHDLDAFLRYCNDYSGTENYTGGASSLRKNYKTASMTDDVKAWATDPAREEGDVTTVKVEDSGYYVLYFVSSTDNDYESLNARIIKISAASTDDDGNETTDWDTAQAKLDELKTAYDESEESDIAAKFETLASTYSDDSDTKYTGGEYTHIYKGQFDDAVDGWLFDSARKDGDVDSVEGEDALYFIYYEGAAGNYRDYLIDSDLRDADYEAWYTALTDGAACERNDFGMKHVNMTLNASTTSSSAS